MEKISVIVLNYNRPHNIDVLIPKLFELDGIDQVVISHGKKDLVDYNHSSVKNIRDWEKNDSLYTMLKFENYDKVDNECVLLIDDDLYPSQELLNDMVDAYKKDKNGLYGPTDRVCHNGYYESDQTTFRYVISQLAVLVGLIGVVSCIRYFEFYDTFLITFSSVMFLSIIMLFALSVTTVKKNNVVLTNICMTNKDVIKNVWENMNHIKNKELLDIVIKNKGNGEDLLFNFIYTDLYKSPTHIKGKYHYLDTSNGFSTTDPEEHVEIRCDLCHTLKDFKENKKKTL